MLIFLRLQSYDGSVVWSNLVAGQAYTGLAAAMMCQLVHGLCSLVRFKGIQGTGLVGVLLLAHMDCVVNHVASAHGG